jgi:hypothetical protein
VECLTWAVMVVGEELHLQAVEARDAMPRVVTAEVQHASAA